MASIIGAVSLLQCWYCFLVTPAQAGVPLVLIIGEKAGFPRSRE
ncbi:hypothetical protein [Sphingomonas ursincola]|jgi:hypothetical protein